MQNKGIFITGTDTGVGKTQVAAGLALALQMRLSKKESQSKLKVKVWKPVQTGAVSGDPAADSYILHMATGCSQLESEVSTLTFQDPVAPWMAAERENTEISYPQLLDEGLKRIKQADYLIVEGAGGLAVPLTEDTLIAHLAQQMGLPVVLVARAGVGTVNHTLLSLYFAKTLGIAVKGIILNGYQVHEDRIVQENVRMIEHYGETPVIGRLPWSPCSIHHPDDWVEWRRHWINMIEEHVDLDCLT